MKTILSDPAVLALRIKFELWRKNRSHSRSRIPFDLLKSAAELTKYYSASKVAIVFQLNTKTLKRAIQSNEKIRPLVQEKKLPEIIRVAPIKIKINPNHLKTENILQAVLESPSGFCLNLYSNNLDNENFLFNLAKEFMRYEK